MLMTGILPNSPQISVDAFLQPNGFFATAPHLISLDGQFYQRLSILLWLAGRRFFCKRNVLAAPSFAVLISMAPLLKSMKLVFVVRLIVFLVFSRHNMNKVFPKTKRTNIE